MRASRAVPLLLCLAAVSPLPFSAPAHAETDVEACDRLASNPADPQRPAEAAGVSREDFDAEEALKTCTRALAAQPTEPRLHYQAGRAAYVLEDYATARVEFETAAKAGYKIAAAGMGILYDHGFGLPRDEEKAIDFYKAAADEIGIASHNLAIIYRDSAETPHDYAASMAYFKTAITLGYTDSLHGIGYAYENGFGVPQDWGKAMHWYRRGAAAGIGDSMNNIGWIYQNGFGVTKDAKVALDWYQKAVDAGNPDAVNNIGNLYETGDGVPQDYAKATEWYQKAVDAGNPLAMANIALFLATGKGGKTDVPAAVDLFFKSLDAGDAPSDDFNRDYVMEGNWGEPFYTALQERLAVAGTYKGKPSGVADDATRDAITAFSRQGS